MAHMKPPRQPKMLIKPFEPDDLKHLLTLCDESTFLGLRNLAIILIFIDTAMRLCEVARMQIEDLDFNRGVIKVHGKGAGSGYTTKDTEGASPISSYAG